MCDKPKTAEYALGLVRLVGIGFHSFLDGIVYSISFSVSMLTGAIVARGMILHEFPAGIVTYALLLRSSFSERQSYLLAFIAAALTTPLGTFVSYPFITQIGPPLLGLLLAFSAGALIYVGRHSSPAAGRTGTPQIQSRRTCSRHSRHWDWKIHPLPGAATYA